MAITKTDFINYTRCPRYVALEQIKKEQLASDMSYQEYKQKEQENELKELYSSIIEAEENVEKNPANKQLEAMLDYYKIVEEEAGKIAQKTFGGTVKYAIKTKDQESFDFQRNGIRFLCYVDIYNEVEDQINIIEVKATTSKKYLDLKSGYPKKEKYTIWQKEKNVYRLKEEIPSIRIEEEMPRQNYEKQKMKLLNRFDLGSYFYDIAIQRFIIEGEYNETNTKEKLKNIHYYLAVLNEEYTFDGTYENGHPVYHPDSEQRELITFFDVDSITKEYQPLIEEEAKKLTENLEKMSFKECPLGAGCGYKKQTMCKYFKTICAQKIPKTNSSLNYVNNGFGFTKEDGTKIKGLELINENYLDMLDIPESWIKNKNHKIQRECYQNHTEYINKEKIKKGLEQLEYPIYHLDFETFPCPVPRFKGEKPYMQSPFEFSLHIESSPGVCEKQKDNIIFLASTTNDEREDLIKCLLSHVEVEKGTLFAQNVSFEKGRIQELANIFPQYREKLMKLYHRGFDLIWLLNTKKELYEQLGFNEQESSTMNYYHEKLSGSFSIKKTLPVFSDLSYQNLVVKNGTEAIIEYANYGKMSKEELLLKQEALKIYCQQDTWAMVEILNALRKKSE